MDSPNKIIRLALKVIRRKKSLILTGLPFLLSSPWLLVGLITNRDSGIYHIFSPLMLTFAALALMVAFTGGVVVQAAGVKAVSRALQKRSISWSACFRLGLKSLPSVLGVKLAVATIGAGGAIVLISLSDWIPTARVVLTSIPIVSQVIYGSLVTLLLALDAYAVRRVVLAGDSPLPALVRSMEMLRTYFVKSVVLGDLLVLTSTLIMVVPAMALAAALFAGGSLGGSGLFIPLVVSGGLSLIVFPVAWEVSYTIAYKQIRRQERKVERQMADRAPMSAA